jgi:small-conductance mechanosensitive channel
MTLDGLTFHWPHWMPGGVVSLLVFAIAIAVALLLHKAVFRIATRLVRNRDLFWRSLVSRNERTLRLTLIALAVAFASQAAPLTLRQASLVQHVTVLCLIGLVTVIALSALHAWTVVYLRRFKLDSPDNLLARKHVTQTQILERVIRVIVIAIGLSVGLMTFEGVRQYGISLLASAGAAGLIAGLALQPVLKNVFAGIQLAITQPIRIDDALVVEGEWGNVEEITATYVVVRIWDLRRLIVPLSHFIEKPFENWTREAATLIGAIVLHLDYRADVTAIRSKAEAILRGTPLWDRKSFAVQVTDLSPETMQVRVIASAANSGDAFDLRCLLRESLVAWLRDTHPEALPVRRLAVEGDDQAPLAAGEGRRRVQALS